MLKDEFILEWPWYSEVPWGSVVLPELYYVYILLEMHAYDLRYLVGN